MQHKTFVYSFIQVLLSVKSSKKAATEAYRTCVCAAFSGPFLDDEIVDGLSPGSSGTCPIGKVSTFGENPVASYFNSLV